MNFIDLFAGVGGVRKGLEKAGHKCVGWCEWDKWARLSYSSVHNTEGEWTAHDIRTVRASDMPRADLWCFGFPCTDISVAGKMQGFKKDTEGQTTEIEEGEQTRSGLFYEVIRLLRELPKEDRPKWLIAENVKNLISIEQGWGFARCLVALGEVGYICEWQLFNTKYSYNVAGVCVPGVPQNRERVYIVGRLVGAGGGRKVFPIQRADTKNPAELQKIAGRWGMDHQAGSIYDKNGLSPALDTCGGGGREPHIVDDDSKVKQIGHIVGYGLENPQPYRVYDESGAAPTLTSASDGKVPMVVDKEVNQIGHGMSKDGKPIQGYGVFDTDGVAPTLTTGHGSAQPYIKANDIVTYNVQQTVSVRKYEVDIPALQTLLRDAKEKSNLTVKQIACMVDEPEVKVAHWFRTDECFAIPSADKWLRLRMVLKIDDISFDSPVMEFVEMDNKFDQSNRAYGIDGVAPTLTRTKSDIQVLGSYSPSGYNATRVVSPEGIAPTVMENHGQVTAVTIQAVLTPDRLEKGQNGRRIKDDGEPMFTLTTQDRHGVAINDMPQVVGGVGEPNAFGKQFRQGNRIYSTDSVSPALQTNNGNASGGSVLVATEDE